MNKPVRSSGGLVILLTGLSGAGKTTLANLLSYELDKRYGRKSTILDGDVVRGLLCSALGFSKSDRLLNLERVGYVASEVAKHGGVAICSVIAPYDESRKLIKEMALNKGANFILIYLSTTLGVCIKRDPKGLYKKVSSGEIQNFTGISDPYEPPKNADLIINTEFEKKAESIDIILNYLESEYEING